MLRDYKCTDCGHEEIDVWVDKFDAEVRCIICNSQMEGQMSGLQVKTPSRTERDLPKNYKPSNGGVDFGKFR